MKEITKKCEEVFNTLSTDYSVTIPQYIRELDGCDLSSIIRECKLVVDKLGIKMSGNKIVGVNDILERDNIEPLYVFFVQYLVVLQIEGYIEEKDIDIIREALESIGCKVYSDFIKLSVFAVVLNE